MSRRLFARATATTLLLCLLAISPAALSAEGDRRDGPPEVTEAQPWPQLQGGPAHLGEAPDGPVPPYRVAWHFQPDPIGGFSSPVIVDDTVYAVSPAQVMAVGLADGAELWRAPRQEGLLVPPAVVRVDDRPVVLFTEGLGEDTQLAAIDGREGDRLWDVALEGRSSAGVTVAGELAFVGVADGTVHAVEVTTGEVAWTYEGDGERLTSALAMAGGRVYYPAQPEQEDQGVRLTVLDAATGERVWRRELPASVSTPVTIRDDAAFVATASSFGGDAAAVETQDGNERWIARLRSGVSPNGAVATDAERVYAVDQVAGLYALDLASGERSWDFQENGTFAVLGAPVAVPGYVVLGLQDGSAIAVDASSGRLVWRDEVAGASLRPPAVGSGFIVYGHGGADGGLVALEHTDGDLLDEVSPTVLDPAGVAVTFALSVALVAAVALGIGRVAGPWLWARGRPDDEGDDVDEDEEAE